LGNHDDDGRKFFPLMSPLPLERFVRCLHHSSFPSPTLLWSPIIPYPTLLWYYSYPLSSTLLWSCPDFRVFFTPPIFPTPVDPGYWSFPSLPLMIVCPTTIVCGGR
jgi:hypothetical protein